MRCDACGAVREHTVHWSDYAYKWLCIGCYLKRDESRMSPLAELAARNHKPEGYPAHKPRKYEVLVRRVWRVVEERTGWQPWLLGAGQLASYCPACLTGTVLFTFVDLQSGPRCKVSSHQQGLGHCSMGCTHDQVMEVIGNGTR